MRFQMRNELKTDNLRKSVPQRLRALKLITLWLVLYFWLSICQDVEILHLVELSDRYWRDMAKQNDTMQKVEVCHLLSPYLDFRMFFVADRKKSLTFFGVFL